jgi:IS30 family transposase
MEVVRMPGRRLTLEEREFIQAARKDGASFRVIGAALGRPHTTISREVMARCMPNGAYLANVAHHRACQRARRPKPFKLSGHRALAGRVAWLLERKWSPAQIAVRLRREHPDDPRWWVSGEAIYHSLYVQGRGGLRAELHQHLRLQRRERKHGNGRGQLADRVHFSLRPAEARDRAVPGHWEGDLILGADRRSQVGMLTERATRYTLLFHLPDDRSAATVRDALVRTIRTLPAHLRRSLTWDNGKEMAQHRAITIATDLQIYFCDPGHPWQRGTAENTVGLLRAYLPRGEDLSRYSARQLASIAAELNRRPRKTLNWRTPAEAYAQALAVQ